MTLGMHLGCVLETAYLAQGSSAKETFEDLVGGRVSGTWVSCCQEGLACQVGLMVASPYLGLLGDDLASVVFVGAAAPVVVVVAVAVVVVVVVAAVVVVVVVVVVIIVVIIVVVVDVDGVDHGEDSVGHGEDKRQESKRGKLSVAAWK